MGDDDPLYVDPAPEVPSPVEPNVCAMRVAHVAHWVTTIAGSGFRCEGIAAPFDGRYAASRTRTVTTGAVIDILQGEITDLNLRNDYDTILDVAAGLLTESYQRIIDALEKL